MGELGALGLVTALRQAPDKSGEHARPASRAAKLAGHLPPLFDVIIHMAHHKCDANSASKTTKKIKFGSNGIKFQ